MASSSQKAADNEIRAKPSAVMKLDANEAVKEVIPGMVEMMNGHSEMMKGNSDAFAQAVQALVAAAQSMQLVAQVMAADSEIVRDPKTNRAIGSRKVMPSRTMN